MFSKGGYLDLIIRDAKLQNVFYFPTIYLNKILEISIAFFVVENFKNIFFGTFLRSDTANELSGGGLHVAFRIRSFFIFFLAKKLFARSLLFF